MITEEPKNIDPLRLVQHPDMPALMGTAHNKPPGRRRPPCLTRHLTLWMPQTLEDALREPKSATGIIPVVLQTLPDSEKQRIADLSYAEQVREAWVLTLEQFILIIYDQLKYDHPNASSLPHASLTNYLQKDIADKELLGLLQNFYEETNFEENGHTKRKYNFKYPLRGTIHHNTVCINGIWHSMPIEIIVELRTEYVTISTTIDLGHRRVTGLYDEREQFYYKHVLQALTDFNDVMARRYAGLKGHENPISKEDQLKLTVAYSTLYHTIIPDRISLWFTLREQFFGSAIETVGADNIGRLIGDMRSLLLRYRNDSPDNFITIHHPEEDKLGPSNPSLLEVIKGNPFGAKPKANRMDDIIRVVDTIKPFMLADPNMAGNTTDTLHENSTELSFSTFFDECGIHASAVSLQNPSSNVEITPLPCLSLITRNEGWELGRLVDLGNRLNTLRLAALYSYSNMIKANRLLHEEEQGLNKLSRDLLVKLQDRHGNENVKNELLEFSRRVAIITYDVPGGLAYRGERSQYYRTQFTAFAKLLRLDEVVGHQPFDEMVERRLGSAYGLITQARERLDRITKSMKEIEEAAETDRTAKQTNTALDLQQKIRELTEQIAIATNTSKNLLEATNSVEQQLRDNAAQTNDLLDNAEIIIAVPLIYYVGHVFTDVFSTIATLVPDIFSAFGIEGKWPLLPHEELIRSAMYIVSFIGIVFALDVLKKRRQQKEKKREQQRGGIRKDTRSDTQKEELGDGPNDMLG